MSCQDDSADEGSYEALIHANQLLSERNQLLRHQNQKMLCQIEMLNVELQHLRHELQNISQHGRTPHRDSISVDGRGTYRSVRPQYEQLVTLRMQKDQISGIFRERVSKIHGKMRNCSNISLQFKDRIELLTRIQPSQSCLGAIKILFDATQCCFETIKKIEDQEKELRSRELSLKIQEQKKNRQQNKENNRIVLVRDPQYIVQETLWITKFEDEFKIVQNFYENLTHKLINREPHLASRNKILTVLMKYEQLQRKKLEMYRLAIRIDNQQRQFKVRREKCLQMESLRLSTEKLVQALRQEEQQLLRLKRDISQLLNSIP